MREHNWSKVTICCEYSRCSFLALNRILMIPFSINTQKCTLSLDFKKYQHVSVVEYLGLQIPITFNWKKNKSVFKNLKFSTYHPNCIISTERIRLKLKYCDRTYILLLSKKFRNAKAFLLKGNWAAWRWTGLFALCNRTLTYSQTISSQVWIIK